MPGPITRALAAARCLIRLPARLDALDLTIGTLLDRLERMTPPEPPQLRRPATPLDIFDRVLR